MHDHDKGLDHDLPRLVSRRNALGVFGSALLLAACGGSDETDATGTSTTSASADSIPEETAGPFPGDGSNGPNVLEESGVVRRDITTSFGDAGGTAEGVPTRLEMTLIDVAGGGGALSGAAVYAWHCDAAGEYSMYDNDENYLRGVQKSDADGKVVFETIFPAAYAGRWPHVHFEVYDSLDLGTKLRTSQLAIPQDICEQVYKTDGYEQSATNLEQTSLDSDMVFSDGYASQLAKVSGDLDNGLTLSLNVGV